MNQLDPFVQLVKPFSPLVPKMPTAPAVPQWQQTLQNFLGSRPITPSAPLPSGQNMTPYTPPMSMQTSSPSVPRAPVQNMTPYSPAPKPVVAPQVMAPVAPVQPPSAPTQPMTPTTSAGLPINPTTGGIVKSPAPPTPPATPVIPPKSNAGVESALKAYTSAQQMSAEEESAQAELDRLQESTILGQNAIRDQAIPMDFITGQSASLERRGLALQVPLEQKLARMQARRQAATEASKFALERADKAAEEDKPIAIDGQLVQRDPTTGAYQSVFGTPKSAEGFTLGEGQTRYDAKGNVIAGGGTGGPGTNPAVDSWVKLLNDGRAKLSDVPNALLSQVAAGLASAPGGQDPKAQYALSQANTALTSIDNALGILSGATSGGVNTAGTAVGRAFGGFIPGSDTTNLNAALDTVKALVGFDALQKMRESSPTGGALGNITEKELAFLQSVQGSLNTMQGTEQLTATINRVKESFQILKMASSPDGTEFVIDGEPYVKQGDQIVPRDFSEVGGDTQQATRAVRNNNPLNIKQSNATSTYSGVTGIDQSPAADGGNFLTFASAQAGFEAAKRLIQTDGYRNLTVDAALRRWSNNGYGAEGLPFAGKTIGQLTSTELDSLIQAMARNEGYYA